MKYDFSFASSVTGLTVLSRVKVPFPRRSLREVALIYGSFWPNGLVPAGVTVKSQAELMHAQTRMCEAALYD
jgi:hypothetical protein